jgi:hypothetical protein
MKVATSPNSCRPIFVPSTATFFSSEELDVSSDQVAPRMSPPKFEGPTFTEITGTQGPTR